MPAASADLAARLDLFEGCDSGTCADVLKGARIHDYPAHAEIVREGDPADCLHVVMSGLVQLGAHDGGHETTTAVLGPLRPFVMAAVYLDRPYLQSARALEPTSILVIQAEPLRRNARRNLALSNNVARELAEEYRAMAQELKNQKLRPGLQRLANWLIRRDIETGETGSFAIPFDKKVLAAKLGMAPEVLSRSFATLAKYDVNVSGRDVEIKDRPSLLRLARPTPLIDDPQA